MPTPNEGETQDEFIERCIPIVIEDGTAEDPDQAYAVCLSMWKGERTMNYIRAFRQEVDQASESGSPIRFVASTEGIKRDGLELKADEWRLENYRTNPVVLWMHGYTSDIPPIGRASVDVRDKQLVADIVFDQEDEFARKVENKYRRGFLHAVSVGWDDMKEGGRVFHDLMDISAVSVPIDPDALIVQETRALQMVLDALTHVGAEYEERAITDSDKSAIVSELKKMSMTDVDERHFPGTVLKILKRGIPLDFSKVDVWDGVSTAMVGLFSPTSAMEDELRQGLYIALERAYRKLGKVAPEFRTQDEVRALTDVELRGLFLNDELVRAGAVLSARNRNDLQQAIDLIQGVMDRATKEDETERSAEYMDVEQLKALHDILYKEK